MRPRILILSTAYFPLIGGSELAIQHITDRLMGYDFDMVTGRYDSTAALSEQIGRVRVFRAGGRWSRLSFMLPKVLMPFAMLATAWRLTRTHSYILVHAYQASQAGGAAWLLKMFRPKLPLIVTIQEGKDLDQQSLLVRWGRALILRSADRITAISTYLANYVRRYTNVPLDIVPNGVDIEKFKVASFKLQEPKEEKVIISVSRLVHKNGIANLIRALPLVRASLPVRLVLVGDGELRASLESLAADMEVAGSIDFIGSVQHSDLPAYLHRADVFVRPSLSEGLGSAFLEAIAAGVPVVASRVGGIGDFLIHEQTGLACDPSSPSDIASKITQLLNDQSLYNGIRERALKMVRERYSWDVVAKQMATVYEKTTI